MSAKRRGRARRNYVWLPHREQLIRHAINKLFVRYGIAIGMPEYRAITDEVRERLDSPDAYTHSGFSVFIVRYRGREIYAGWNHRFDCIGTFLTCFPDIRQSLDQRSAPAELRA